MSLKDVFLHSVLVQDFVFTIFTTPYLHGPVPGASSGFFGFNMSFSMIHMIYPPIWGAFEGTLCTVE